MTRWPTKPLAELVAFEKGKKAPEVFPTPTPTSLRYLQIEDLRPNSTLKYCEPFNCPKATSSDVIIAWDGANAGTVSHNLAGHIGSTLAVLRPIAGSLLSSAFLSRFLEGNFNYLQRTATGATIPHVSKDALNGLYIPVPPLTEQERIVKLLDEAEELRKLRAQADRRTAALIPSLFHDMFGDPISDPKGYKVARLEEVTTRITDGVHLKPNYTMTGIPFISVKNITTGQLTFDDCKFISAEDHQKFTKRCKAEYLDILYTKVGATYGRPALVDTKTEFSIYVSVCLIKPMKDVIDPHFLEVALGTPAVKSQADRSIKGIGVPDLHLDQIQKFLLPLPPLSLQKEFAVRVSDIRALQAEQAASRRRLDDLFHSMLHRAFQGEI
jgi:type I restriction enzyme S subunit